jgi:hypothetical protein
MEAGPRTEVNLAQHKFSLQTQSPAKYKNAFSDSFRKRIFFCGLKAKVQELLKTGLRGVDPNHQNLK